MSPHHAQMNIIYNKKNLHIDNKNTLIIIDWDDTLYPTSWVVENSIDLTDPKTRFKYSKHFDLLDNNLSSVLKQVLELGEVIIITNALSEWIELSSSVLPKTKKCLKYISVVSARARYQNSSKMTEWKKLTFVDEINKRSHKKYTNILSLGDAEFEHIALINLHTLKTVPHKYLKSIKFMKTTDYLTVIEQLEMIKNSISDICKLTRHMDLMFDTNKTT